MYKIIGVDSKEYGPVTLDQLKEWITAGRVNRETRVQPEGSTDWKPAAEIPEIAAILPPPLPPPGSIRPVPPAPTGSLPTPLPKTNGLAITSFVLGIVSYVLCLTGLSGIPAVICGHIAQRQIRNSSGQQRGAGLALAGLIMGYASLLFILVLPAMLLPALARAKERAQSINCVNNMKQIGLAFRMWETDHDEKFPFHVGASSGGTEEFQATGEDGFDKNTPEHLKVLANYLGTTKVLVCPADQSKLVASGFPGLQAQNVSYRLRTGPEVTTKNGTQVLAVCPVHGHVLHCDGSVEMKRSRRGGAPRN